MLSVDWDCLPECCLTLIAHLSCSLAYDIVVFGEVKEALFSSTLIFH